MEITADDGKNYNTEVYNLDAIIAVGYRVNSKKATEFRIWATNILKEYMIKGLALNDERFINENKYDTKYFDDVLKQLESVKEWHIKKLQIYLLQQQQITIPNQKKLILSLK